jgi:hypothetical protein
MARQCLRLQDKLRAAEGEVERLRLVLESIARKGYDPGGWCQEQARAALSPADAPTVEPAKALVFTEAEIRELIALKWCKCERPLPPVEWYTAHGEPRRFVCSRCGFSREQPAIPAPPDDGERMRIEDQIDHLHMDIGRVKLLEAVAEAARVLRKYGYFKLSAALDALDAATGGRP